MNVTCIELYPCREMTPDHDPHKTAPEASAAPSQVAEFDAFDLVAQVGSEVAEAMSSALERVNSLTLSGRIDRSSLRALRDEIESARRAGMLGQQVSRVASGRIRLSEEQLDLTTMLREALSQRSREMAARALEVKQILNPASVRSDATLLFSMLQGVLDWSFENAISRIDLAVEVKTWPAQAQLQVAFDFGRRDTLPPGSAPPRVAASLQTMSWRLVERCAHVLGLTLERQDRSERTVLTLGFPRTQMTSETLDALLDLGQENDAVHTLSGNSKPLAGSHVLVVSTQREVRAAVREVVRSMGVMLDFVSTVDEAREFCAGGLPHAIVYESALGGGRMQRLMAELMHDAPALPFIEIAEQGRPFEVMNVLGRERTRVSKHVLAEALPKALIFELARRP